MAESCYMKWQISIFSAFIFLLVSNPYTYKITNSIFSRFLGPVSTNGCPTMIGLLLHTVVYILLVRYSMELHLFR